MGLALIVPNISFESANLGRVTIAEDVPLVSLAVSGPDSVTGAEDAQQYSAAYTPANTNQRAVVWSIQSGGQYASISASSGMLSVLEGATAAAVTIRVTSSVNPSIYAEKTIAVTYQAEQILPAGATPCDLVFTGSDGTFVDTGIVPAAAVMAYDAVVLWSNGSTDSVLIGLWETPNDYTPIARRGTGPMYVAFGGYSAAYDGTFPTEPSIVKYRHKVVVKSSGATIETYDEGGSLLNTQSITYDGTGISFSGTLAIFGEHSGSSISASTKFIGGAGRVKFYSDENFNTIVADFVPCYYNGSFGFWDVVSQALFTGNNPANVYGIGSAWDTQGFIPNTSVTSTNTLQRTLATITTRVFDVPSGCASIQFNAGVVGAYTIVLLDDGGNVLTFFSYNEADRVISVPSGVTKVRMAVDMATMGTAYIKDLTNDVYIWKGADIE